MDYQELFQLKSKIAKADCIKKQIDECNLALQYAYGYPSDINEKAYNKMCDTLHLEIKPLLQQYLKELHEQFKDL